jgi:hypothetical protein
VPGGKPDHNRNQELAQAEYLSGQFVTPSHDITVLERGKNACFLAIRIFLDMVNVLSRCDGFSLGCSADHELIVFR